LRFARRDVVETVDGADDLAGLIRQWPDIDDDGDPRAVWPLDVHFGVGSLRQCAGHHFGHGTLIVRHKSAVRTEQLERATKALVRVSRHRFAAPQFRRAPIELLNHTGGVAGIDRDGTELKYGSIALFIPIRRPVQVRHGLDGLSAYLSATAPNCRQPDSWQNPAAELIGMARLLLSTDHDYSSGIPRVDEGRRD